ncbi:hypothetical protein ACFX2J_045673 [Malus domestica]
MGVFFLDTPTRPSLPPLHPPNLCTSIFPPPFSTPPTQPASSSPIGSSAALRSGVQAGRGPLLPAVTNVVRCGVSADVGYAGQVRLNFRSDHDGDVGDVCGSGRRQGLGLELRPSQSGPLALSERLAPRSRPSNSKP